jgi:hypothetical protein
MTAHLEVLLDGNSYSRAIVRVLPGDVPEVASDLLKIRDGYEDKFRRLINDLNLPDDANPGLMRLFLLSAMNVVPLWFDYRNTAADIAKAMLEPFERTWRRKT